MNALERLFQRRRKKKQKKQKKKETKEAPMSEQEATTDGRQAQRAEQAT